MHRTRNRTLLALGTLSVLLALATLIGLADTGTAAGQAAPRNTSPPTVSGTPQQGQTLTGTRGQWSNNPTDYNYFWTRCGRNGGSCANISGAHAATYRLTSADVGTTIRFKVQARNSDGSAFESSVPTAIVRAAPRPPVTTGCEANAPLNVAGISAPERLTIDQQQVTPAVVGRSSRTVTVRFRVSCRGKAVQGALVYVTAVPFSQYTIPAETPTGADGFAQMTMTQLSGFPASRSQQLLVIFARARKPGENVLGGISSRRLVSFPVDLRR